eukprot:GHUV01037155.1.p1 GENE.GHUV01037155.1~~GHUV01037155.1.p1  ORF type:complete len:117 (+),score=6.06 GHUV01037155.1:182-532(+)
MDSCCIIETTALTVARVSVPARSRTGCTGYSSSTVHHTDLAHQRRGLNARRHGLSFSSTLCIAWRLGGAPVPSSHESQAAAVVQMQLLTTRHRTATVQNPRYFRVVHNVCRREPKQ